MKRTSKKGRNIDELALQIFRSDSYLIINKKLLKRMGPGKAVFIENLMDKYSYFKKEDMLTKDGGFYHTHKNQIEQTGLTDAEIRRYKKELSDGGFLITVRRGVPAKEFYFINFEFLLRMVMEEDFPVLHDSQGLVLHDSEGLYNNTKYNKPKNNNTFFEIKNNNKKSIQERTIEFLPLAKKLASIIKQNKNINTPPNRLKSWANEIRKLIETDGVPIERVVTALNWYRNNIGGQYIPVIESGASLRYKFTRLEDAIKRSGVATRPNPNKGQPVRSENPKKVIHQHFKNKDMTNVFYRDCYLPMTELFDEKVAGEELALYLLKLYEDINQIQEKKLSPDLRRLLPGPMSLVSHYAVWIEDNRWITVRTLDLLDINHVLFRRFCREEAKSDNRERDPLTGKSYLK